MNIDFKKISIGVLLGVASISFVSFVATANVTRPVGNVLNSNLYSPITGNATSAIQMIEDDNFRIANVLADAALCIGASCLDTLLDLDRGTYAWQTSSWGACTLECGSGTRVRDVWCERSDGAEFNESVCTSRVGTKPVSSQTCNTQACPGGYDPGECIGDVYNEETGTWFRCP